MDEKGKFSHPLERRLNRDMETPLITRPLSFQLLESYGVQCELESGGKEQLPGGGELDVPPILFGQLGKDPKKKTVLVYGHLDVQPAEKACFLFGHPARLELLPFLV